MGYSNRSASSSSHPTLTVLEGPTVWSAFEHTELPLVMFGTIRDMGLSWACDGIDFGAAASDLGAAPRLDEVRLALYRDEVVHEQICVRVWEQFCTAVSAGYVWRDQAGGFLATVTRRTTQRLATRRASELLAHASGDRGHGLASDRLGDGEPLPDEQLDTARLRAVLEHACAGLTELERSLLGLDDGMVDYAAISRATGIRVGTLRVRACRLVERIRARVLSEVGDVEDAAE